jgi:hypothetical protein
MNANFKNLALLLAGACLLLSGCTGTPVTLKSFSAKDIVPEKSRPISAEACGFQLLLFIPIGTNSRSERAFTELRKKADNDYIADLSIEEYWRYGFVGTLYCTKLEANAYPKAASN